MSQVSPAAAPATTVSLLLQPCHGVSCCQPFTCLLLQPFVPVSPAAAPVTVVLLLPALAQCLVLQSAHSHRVFLLPSPCHSVSCALSPVSPCCKPLSSVYLQLTFTVLMPAAPSRVSPLQPLYEGALLPAAPVTVTVSCCSPCHGVSCYPIPQCLLLQPLFTSLAAPLSRCLLLQLSPVISLQPFSQVSPALQPLSTVFLLPAPVHGVFCRGSPAVHSVSCSPVFTVSACQPLSPLSLPAPSTLGLLQPLAVLSCCSPLSQFLPAAAPVTVSPACSPVTVSPCLQPLSQGLSPACPPFHSVSYCSPCPAFSCSSPCHGVSTAAPCHSVFLLQPLSQCSPCCQHPVTVSSC
ncbi:keratin-associated protein 9-1-like [Peromyscus leucopus]|uniref:keratin-associated protein 9-1-like n=1 Tax=Peromyscus leucopus TaxID=10041 RepID=UPI0010A11A14|nr:keratin-associated protein 9-1-like [Peromyscus leucopus]